ncbi:Class I histocompatibility antigen, F10 alpha chain, partial [Eudyptes moseleyi]
SLFYFFVGVSEPSPGVPQFVVVGDVDGNVITRYDSEMGRTVPVADWMAEKLGQQYWDGETQIAQRYQQTRQNDLGTL